MKRYYGGVLDQQTENKKQFYQGKDDEDNDLYYIVEVPVVG